MGKKTRRAKKNKDSSIDEEFIDSYNSLNKMAKIESEPFKYDLLGKLSLKKLNKVKVEKTNFKKRNSPEFVKIQKIKRKLAFSNKMQLDSSPLEPSNDTTDSVSVVEGVNKDEFDIWSDSKPEKKGGRHNKIGNINQMIPAVEVPHPGQSYNPDPQDYIAYVNKTVEIISNKEKESLPQGASVDKSEATRENDELGPQLDEQTVQNVEPEVEEEDMDDPDDKKANPKTKLKRKTKAERNKIKVIKMEKRKLMAEKRIKKLKNDVEHIKKIRSSLKKTDNKYRDRLVKFKDYLKRLVSGEVPTKIGNKSFFPEPTPIKLNMAKIEGGESDGLIRTVGNDLENPVNFVYKSIYKRGLLPPPPDTNSSYKKMIRRLYSRRSAYRGVLSK